MKPGNPQATKRAGCKFRQNILVFCKMRGRSEDATPYHRGFFIGVKLSTTAHIPISIARYKLSSKKNIDEDE